MAGPVFSGFELPEDIRQIVKAADMLDEVLHLCQEISMGNRSVLEVFKKNTMPRLREAWFNLPVSSEERERTFEEVIRPAIDATAVFETPHLPTAI